MSSSPPINPVVSNILPFLQFGYEGRVPLKSARLFYDISEKARKIVESYFMLNSTLYFSYTHMVCRTALSGEISESELVPVYSLWNEKENNVEQSSRNVSDLIQKSSTFLKQKKLTHSDFSLPSFSTLLFPKLLEGHHSACVPFQIHCFCLFQSH